MPFATSRDQVKLHYTIDDFTDPWKNAPYLLLQHGFGRHGGFWYKWIPYLSRFYKVIRPDMRGFGQSREGFSGAPQFSLDDLVDDLLAILDHAGIDKVHYCGEAFGGAPGVQIGALHSHRLRTLNLISVPPALRRGNVQAFALGETSWHDALRKHGVAKWAEETNKQSRFPKEMGQGFLDWYAAEIGKTDLETLIRFTELTSTFDQTKYLSQIKVPVFGVYSTFLTPQTDVLRAEVKDLRLIHIEASFTQIHQVYPRLCAEAVLHSCAQFDGFSATE